MNLFSVNDPYVAQKCLVFQNPCVDLVWFWLKQTSVFVLSLFYTVAAHPLTVVNDRY